MTLLLQEHIARVQQFAASLQKLYVDWCDSGCVWLHDWRICPEAHTNKPAVIAFLHDTDEISLPQLQLIVVLWHITVQSLETGAGHEDKLVNMQNL